MLIALSSAASGGGSLHDLRREPVDHEALEDPLLDENFLLGDVPLVVDVEGAALVGEGGAVDDGAELRGDPLAGLAGVEGGPFMDKVCFQSVPDRFMQEHAAPARA